MQNSNKNKIRTLTLIAVFIALAYISVTVLKFNVQFLTFDLKDAIMTVGAMLLGPIAGLIMAFLVALIEFLTVSDTGVYGFIMNALSSIAFVVTASLIYKYKKTLLGAILGLLSAAGIMTAVMMLANLLITPYYMGASPETVAGMIPTLLLPFNLVKAIFNASLVMLIYKPVSNLLKRIRFIGGDSPVFSDEGTKKKNVLTTVLVAVCSFLVLAASVAVIFLVLHGSITWF